MSGRFLPVFLGVNRPCFVSSLDLTRNTKYNRRIYCTSLSYYKYSVNL